MPVRMAPDKKGVCPPRQNENGTWLVAKQCPRSFASFPYPCEFSNDFCAVPSSRNRAAFCNPIELCCPSSNHICISWHHSADDTKELKEKLKAKNDEIAALNKRVKEAEARVKQVEVELAASVSKIEISCEAAVGQAKVLIAQQCQEAYKEGVRDTKTLFKEMRSMF